MPDKVRTWLSTPEAAEALGISSRQLRILRADLKFGTHYRSISRASAMRKTYQWNLNKIQAFLEQDPDQRPGRLKPTAPDAAESE